MILASNNEGKVRELREILVDVPIKSLKEAGISVEVEEDQDSFYKNALKKAKEIAILAKEATIADDSGLEIAYYNGWPGVHTARFLGKNTTARQRNEAILVKMKGLKGKQRKACVMCVLVYYDLSGEILIGEGKLEGYIADQIRGENGFGFDEIFEVGRTGKTLAQLPAEEKNRISARYLAIKDLYQKLK